MKKLITRQPLLVIFIFLINNLYGQPKAVTVSDFTAIEVYLKTKGNDTINYSDSNKSIILTVNKI